ncbi:MAG: C25 family cysteine peptidase [Chitinophagaceae bacterium]|nr:C25 family cysteine peptidase [Chitinophagaceae bacterium]
MKKLFTILAVFGVFLAKAQFNNEWIDYNKTYFKFRVGADGIYRIPQSVLQAAGIGATPAEQFQLWRNGEEVAIFTSVSSGTLGASDFIEFYGLMNDGKPDTKLYRNPSLQLASRWSLETDTAAYFLTVNPAGPNQRIVSAANTVAGNSLPAEPYFMHTHRVDYRTKLNPGFAAVVGEYVYSSSYDMGETWSSRDVTRSTPLVENLVNLHVAASGPSARVEIAASGNALNSREVQLFVNGNQAISQAMNFFNGGVFSASIPVGIIGTVTDTLRVVNNTISTTDRMVVARMSLTYPRQFNFGGSSNFEFSLPASAAGNYLEISNFNSVGGTPLLYDLTNNRRYEADMAVPGTLRFVLPASGARNLVLMGTAAAFVRTISSLQIRNFIDFSQPAHHGDYLIISNSRLYNGANGNPVENYRAFRSSTTGGGYNAKTFDIDQLVDQFAFGIKEHPLSVKNFLAFTRARFPLPPRYAFLIGRGLTYDQLRIYENRPSTSSIALVPTFGSPGSDNLLASDGYDAIPKMAIGRLAAVYPQEVENYLAKVREHESALLNSSQTLKDKGWMKNVVHAIGGSDPYLQAVIYGYMNASGDILKDTLFGGNIKSYSKNSAFSVQQLTSVELQNLFSEGINILTYFGHSSSNTLEFNLDDPNVYDNKGKYPMFIVNGCNAGNFFLYDTARFTGSSLTLSEKYVIANQRGSIGFVASTHYGIVNYLNIYTNSLYSAISGEGYGKPIGDLQIMAIEKMLSLTGSTDFYGRMHAEEITLHGDPAVAMYGHPQPDYVVEDPQVKINPSFVSVADASFDVEARIFNIGRAVKDSIVLHVQRQLPSGALTELFRKKIAAIRYVDSVKLTVPINPLTDKGENKIIVTIDEDNAVVETDENNNSVTKSVVIIENEVRPVYPYNFSIVNNGNITFYASSANPLSGIKNYLMEVDTTELFNSSFKKSQTISSPGGLLQFTVPGLSLQDSTVYYWRTAPAPTGSGTPLWNSASFVYLPNSTPGYNQSHYFQFLENEYTDLTLDPDRAYRFGQSPAILKITTGLFPIYTSGQIRITLDEGFYVTRGCRQGSLQIAIYDTNSLVPMRNLIQPGGQGLFRSWAPCPNNPSSFEYPYNDFNYRVNAMKLLDSLPSGYYVSITNYGSTTNTSFVQQWMADTAVLGSGKSLYHTLKRLGFVDIDNFTINTPFLFFFKKGDPNYPITSVVGRKQDDYIDKRFDLMKRKSSGRQESPWFGPATSWNSFRWQGRDLDAPADKVSMELYGRDAVGNEQLVATVNPSRDTSLAFVDAQRFPFLKMRVNTRDSIQYTPNQLGYWRLNGVLPPEGAIAPNIRFSGKDTLELGEQLNFELAFKNISAAAFDSMKVNMVLTDRNNVPKTILIPKRRPIQAGDTLLISYQLDTKDYPGSNTLFLNINPDYDQPEQYLFNNFIFKEFYVKPDNYDPTLDVTFNGIHILNRDIVSSKPHVLVKLKDNSRFMELNDTSLMKVKVRFPSGEIRDFRFDNDTLRFTPANTGAGGDTTATIDFTPYFPEDGEYELIVNGKDRSGNQAGQLEYKVMFTIINKPMISNLLNYPNPFTTSTAFVFTLTGSEVPENMKIQIMTVTGKIVREITREELGPIRIGRNITDFKWDGTDQYGQKLANGVYLYRFVTSLNGKSLDKLKQQGDQTDKYFNNGYGKMYLMR